LPEREGDRISGYSLYVALRLCHRSRDIKAISRVIVKSLMGEVQALQEMAVENITKIREIVQSLMCISQIVDWTALRKEQAARGYDKPIEDWHALYKVEDGFQYVSYASIQPTTPL